ncbi:MAG: DUF1554 domain-containing protein [Pseudomonadales bacterium]|jgi:hypothetical protein|nr:DUF1554 domain-containing protein [Pseudomonadales bacterium]
MKIRALTLACSLLTLSIPAFAQPPGGGGGGAPQDTSMSFFVTSVGLGDGANLGGLAGADAHCQALAEAAGSTGKTWHAYLSTNGPDGVNARDRIGAGPWYNQAGTLVARNPGHLHFSNVLLSKQNALTEKGALINGIGDAQPLEHDMLTGSNPDGTASDLTCNNWTANDDSATAVVGHVDRAGGGAMAESWNAAHNSRGCSADQLKASGGNGYFYCFAQ